jgi:hypothetical protein
VICTVCDRPKNTTERPCTCENFETIDEMIDTKIRRWENAGGSYIESVYHEFLRYAAHRTRLGREVWTKKAIYLFDDYIGENNKLKKEY